MKLLEFKRKLSQRWNILKANSRFAFQKEMAYAGNNWAGVISTTCYTLSMLLFVNIIFANTKEIAGYSQNEMFFFFLMMQFTYYFTWYMSLVNIYELISDVNKGNLDLILVKPVPSLFYLTSRNIGGFSFFVDSFPPTLAIILSIKWHELSINSTNLFYGILIFIFGIVAVHVFQFISALPVFWLGESASIVDLAGFVSSGSGVMIPLEGYSQKLQFLLGTIIPVLISTAFSASAILGKTDAVYLFYWSLFVVIGSVVLKKIAWKIAIKNYTSASS